MPHVGVMKLLVNTLVINQLKAYLLRVFRFECPVSYVIHNVLSKLTP